MKKRILSLITALLAIFILAACKTQAVTDLSLSGYTSSYTVGDTFSSSGLIVEAVAGSEKTNVTAEASIDASAVDMTTPGTYAVVVKYGDVQRAYYVTVNEEENTQTLIGLEIDTTKAKLSYLTGETFSSDGIALIATYSNSDGSSDTTKYLTDLTTFTIEVKDSNSNLVTGSFTSAGSYEVIISQNDVSQSYNITVTNGAASVEAAVNAAIANKNLVAGGESINNDPNTNSYFGRTTASYEYGPNLNSITYTYQGNHYVENYFINSDNEVVGVRVNEDFVQSDSDPYAKPLTILDNLDSSYVNGIEYSLFAGKVYCTGAETLLQTLYDLGKSNPNYDYAEAITERSNDLGQIEYVYNFSFGYLVEAQTTTVFYLNMVDVSFTLGAGNFLESLEVSDDIYVVSEMMTQFTIMPKGEPNSDIFYAPDRIFPDGSTEATTNPTTGYPKDFPVILDSYTINDCMARLKPDAGTASTHYSNSFSIHQYSGERDAVNKYPESEIYVQSYNVRDTAGNILDDLTFDTTIDNSNTSDSAINLVLTDFNSETARTIDTVSFIYNGKNIGNFSDGSNGLILYYNLTENTLRIRCFNYGVYELEMVTLKTSKKITINVDWRAPLTFTTQVFQDNVNPELATFVKRDTIDCFVGDTIYFNVEPDATGDPEYITSCSNSSAIIINNPTENLPEVLVNYQGYFSSFTTNEVGTYVIDLKSNRNNIHSILTVNVKPEPDFSENLTGTYTFEALSTPNKVMGTITFTLDSELEGLGGSAEIKLGAFTEIISFNYANRAFSNVGHIDGDEGRISLSLNENLEIVISGSYHLDGSVVYSFNSVLTRQEG